MTPTALPTPDGDRADLIEWVGHHLAGLYSGALEASPRFRGGQRAADDAMAAFEVAGYAKRRNEVWPESRRGASALSPYIRHGLLQLPRMWNEVADGPSSDVRKFRDELLWQEYARHLYARVGGSTRRPLRYQQSSTPSGESPWPSQMACVDLAMGELERDGWMVNQTRMWMASQWAVRHGADWTRGEDHFFVHLLDGSRAANRVGWQWTAGLLTGKQYGFSRWQVEKRAPGLCGRCELADACPIQDWPAESKSRSVDADPRLRSDPDVAATAGPDEPQVVGDPEAVWITAESLGDDDPALAANPDLPAVFVFDRRLLERLGLTAKRLVFLAETLADLADRRPVEVHLGSPVQVLRGRRLAATYTPVPGWRRISRAIEPVAVHPWSWLRRPHAGPVSSFSAWRKRLR